MVKKLRITATTDYLTTKEFEKVRGKKIKRSSLDKRKFKTEKIKSELALAIRGILEKYSDRPIAVKVYVV